MAVRNCLECRQRQRDRSCKSSLTSSKSQDSLHSASTTGKVPHTQIQCTYHFESDTETCTCAQNAPHLIFCLQYLAGSRQTPAGCGHQSSSSCGFQRCGKRVFVYVFYVHGACVWVVQRKNIFYFVCGLFSLNTCVCVSLFCHRMTVSRLSFWRWQSSTLSQFSWYLSTGTFWNPRERLAGPPAYQGEASATR